MHDPVNEHGFRRQQPKLFPILAFHGKASDSKEVPEPRKQIAMYKLYGFGELGNAYKCALMLELTASAWECVSVDFFQGETRRPEFREHTNEMGEAPVLVDGDVKLSQSGVILHYLSEKTGQFGPKNDPERREIWRWILFDNHKFTANYASLRFLLGLQNTGETAVTVFLRDRAINAFAIVEKHLKDRPFLVADRLTIADLSLIGYLYYDEKTGIDFKSYPNIVAWRERVAALPRWRAPYDLMPRVLSRS